MNDTEFACAGWTSRCYRLVEEHCHALPAAVTRSTDNIREVTSALFYLKDVRMLLDIFRIRSEDISFKW
jgi:hypothetical protein